MELILGIGVGAFVIYSGFNIAYLVSMRRTSERLGELVRNSEGNLNRTLEGLASTLENLRTISGNVSDVTEDVRQISQTVANVERVMRESLVQMQERFGDAAEANIAGLRAGITTGVAALVRNLQEERRDDHERGTGKT